MALQGVDNHEPRDIDLLLKLAGGFLVLRAGEFRFDRLEALVRAEFARLVRLAEREGPREDVEESSVT